MTSTVDETEYLRQIIAFLLTENFGNTVDLWDDDINAMTGTLTVEVSPDRQNSTRLTYAREQARPPKRERTPINHRVEAEKHASQAAHLKSDRQHHPIDPIASDFHLRMTMVHATLARGNESTAGDADMRDALTLLRRREHAVRDAVSTHIAHALASREPARWKAAVDLAKTLDEGDANLDDLVDAHLTDDGWDARSAWKVPASATPAGDPWASTDLTADTPEPVRRAIASQLARMLLSSDGDAVHAWARNFAAALANEGASFDDAIKARICELTLGATDVPF